MLGLPLSWAYSWHGRQGPTTRPRLPAGRSRPADTRPVARGPEERLPAGQDARPQGGEDRHRGRALSPPGSVLARPRGGDPVRRATRNRTAPGRPVEDNRRGTRARRAGGG